MVKTITRNIPPERENQNDRFRVQYKDRSAFKRLEVIVYRTATGDRQAFYFSSKRLPQNGSIHFTTTVIDNELIVTFNEVTPELPNQPVVIELKQDWFKTGYYVYAVALKYQKERYFYIGMTGDRKYVTARSPFYRMSGHFNRLTSSTENQVLKGIHDKLGIIDISQCTGEFQITYYSYLVEPFMEISPNHHSKRIRTEMVESALIDRIKKEFPETLLNKNLSRKKFAPGRQMADEIYEDLKKRKVIL